MEEAERFECPACVEERRGDPRPPAAEGFPPSPWHTVGSDLFEWEHPITQIKSKCFIAVDEYTHVPVVVNWRNLQPGENANITAAELHDLFWERWVAVYRRPARLRVLP